MLLTKSFHQLKFLRHRLMSDFHKLMTSLTLSKTAGLCTVLVEDCDEPVEVEA